MPSEKLTRILNRKSPFSADEIAAISETDGWKWVYEQEKKPKSALQTICFTGFNASECVELEALVQSSGFLKSVGSVSSKLSFLCIGGNPGPKKIEKAKAHGVTFLTRDQFTDLLADGLLP